LDKMLSGIPRRIKGFILLIRLVKKKDFAFSASVVLNAQTLRNQLFPTTLERLKP